MTYWHQSRSRNLIAAEERADARARPLSRGLGLAIGAMVSLGLWAGLAYGAVRLLG
jgi:hypothetical protein